MTDATDHQEIEWQFDAPDLDAIEAWLRAVPETSGWRVEPRPARVLTDTYLDSADRHMHRAGYTLRIRRHGSRAEATIKGHDGGPDADGLRSRREVTQPLGPAEGPTYDAWICGIPGVLAAEVTAQLGSASLVELLTLRTERRVYDLRRGGREVAEVVLDRTTVLDGDAVQGLPSQRENRPHAILQRVEIEATSQRTAEVAPFVTWLREECGLRPGATSKFGWALEQVGLGQL